MFETINQGPCFGGLLAMREDADQSSRSAPPDALHGSSPVTIGDSEAARTGSSVPEAVEAYDELAEMALLLTNETESLDIREVHLSFCPQSHADSGMPTLQRTGNELRPWWGLLRTFRLQSYNNDATFVIPCSFDSQANLEAI